MAPKSVPAPERFWPKVVKSDGCWLWTAGVVKGYGQFWHNGHNQKAHRVAWQLAYGPIPDGLCVCHRCDTPLCVNPTHLFLGTNRENVADRQAKGRGNPPRGEAVRNAKITDADALAIRADKRLLREIATEYGVSQGQVSEIRNGKSWRHVA
jgi:hypothetical protein